MSGVGRVKSQESEFLAVEEKIRSLLSQRGNLVGEVKRLRERRRELLAEARSLGDRAKEHRERLANVRGQLQATRERRNQTIARLKELRVRARQIRQDLDAAERNHPRLSGPEAEERIRKIEWRIQTERLTRDQEKELVSQVKELGRQVQLWRKASAIREQLAHVHGEIEVLQGDLEGFANNRSALAPEFETSRARLTDLVKARDQIWKELDDLEADIGELAERLDALDREIGELRSKRRAIDQSIRTKEQSAYREKLEGALTEAKRAARQKMTTGGRLTFEELKLALDESEALK